MEKYSVNTRTRQNTGRRTRGERLDKAARRHNESSGTTVGDKLFGGELRKKIVH